MWGGMYYIYLAQDNDKGQALVKAVRNLGGSIKCGGFPE
jgi:hypothetical protein